MMLFENVSNLAADTCPAFDDDFYCIPTLNVERHLTGHPRHLSARTRVSACVMLFHALNCSAASRAYKPLSANSDSCLPAVKTAGEKIA